MLLHYLFAPDSLLMSMLNVSAQKLALSLKNKEDNQEYNKNPFVHFRPSKEFSLVYSYINLTVVHISE